MGTYLISDSILPYLNICNQLGIHAVNISNPKDVLTPHEGMQKCLIICRTTSRVFAANLDVVYKSIEYESKIWSSQLVILGAEILGAESSGSGNHCFFPASHAFLFVLLRVCALVLGCISAILFVSSLISRHKLKRSV